MHAYCITAYLAYIKINMDKGKMENFYNWIPPEELVAWAKYAVHVTVPNQCMTDDDIHRTIRWIGDSSWDTIFFQDGTAHWGESDSLMCCW